MCDRSWKTRAITLTKQNKSTSETLGVQLHMLSNISVKFHGPWLNTFWAMCDKSWKWRAITLTKQNKSTSETLGAQLHMLNNISVKFHDPWLNTFGAMCDTSWKLQIFTKSRAITLTKQNKSTSEIPGAQLHMLRNIPVMVHDYRSNTFWAQACNTSWKLQRFTKSRAITLQILHKSTRKYPVAQLHMLSNITVKFQDFRSNSFWATCDTKWNIIQISEIKCAQQ
jgi:hypothetical protein